jgi:hypothetical protein
MSFDIAQTPTLQAVATLDQELLVEDLQQRVETAARQAGELLEVVAANAEERRAADRLAQLRKAERVLSHFAKESGDRLADMRQRSLDALIESASGTEKLDFKALSDLAALEARGRQAIRAIETLVERLIPEAQLLHWRAESHGLSARARGLEQLAQERAEKLLGQLRDAVSEEVVLPVDLSKGVSGALLAQASECKRQAVQFSENADALEKTLRRPI